MTRLKSLTKIGNRIFWGLTIASSLAFPSLLSSYIPVQSLDFHMCAVLKQIQHPQNIVDVIFVYRGNCECCTAA